MKKSLIIIYMITALMLGLTSAAFAVTEMEILVDKLVEKGILTPAEGDKIVRETKEEAKKQKEETKKAVAKDLLPEWVSKTKFYGDFRLRYQYVDVNNTRSQSEGRFRVRLNLETEIAKDLKFIFGIASGGNDPRSSNQSFTNDYDKKQININLAYVKYKPYQWLELQGGKMLNPIYTVSQLIYDEDINPEGVSAPITYAINPCLDLFVNSYAFVLNDNKNNTPKDAWQWGFQPGFVWKPDQKNTQVKFAAGYTSFENFQGQPQQKYSSGTNTFVTEGKDKVYRWKYNLVTMTGEVGFRNPIPIIPQIRYAGVFGEYTNNISTSSGKSGYLSGLTFGDEKVVDKGQWYFKGSYRRLEANAVPDNLPDSDFYFGYTGVAGYTLQYRYGLMKNVNFTTTYFRAGQIKSPANMENLFQADLNFKF